MARKQPVNHSAELAQYEALTDAIRSNDVNEVQSILSRSSGAVVNSNGGNSNNARPISVALSRYKINVPIVAALLDAGAEVNFFDAAQSRSPLASACSRDSLPAACLLLAAGASPDNAFSLDRYTPLYYSISRKNDVLIDTLLDAGADPTRRTSKGEHAVSHAVKLYKTALSKFQDWRCPPTLTGQEWWQRRIKGMTQQELFTPKYGSQKTYMHHRSAWDYLSSHIVHGLDVAGEPLTKADFLAKRDDWAGASKSLAELGVRYFKLSQLQEALMEIGDPLIGEDLVENRGKLTPLGQAVVDTWQFRDLFALDVWKGTPLRALQQFHAALSPEQKELVPNFHQLCASVRREQRAEARGV